MIRLTRRVPEKGMARWYTVHVQRNLFGAWVVWCAWGSLETDFQQARYLSASDRRQAEQMARRIVAEKVRRGYLRSV